MQITCPFLGSSNQEMHMSHDTWQGSQQSFHAACAHCFLRCSDGMSTPLYKALARQYGCSLLRYAKATHWHWFLLTSLQTRICARHSPSYNECNPYSSGKIKKDCPSCRFFTLLYYGIGKLGRFQSPAYGRVGPARLIGLGTSQYDYPCTRPERICGSFWI